MSNLVARVKQSSIPHLLLAITFFVSGLIINIIQCLLYFGVRPFSRYLFRKINYYLSYSMYSQVVFLAEWWSNSNVVVYSDKEEFDKYCGKEHGYLLMNHRYEIDWLMGWFFCERMSLLGNCKTYAKKSIQYVPILGWAWKFGECIFLERSWEKDKEIIGRQIRELVDYPDSMWLLLMAEGTRFTHEKHEASKIFAREKGLPQLNHHLVPRTKGFTSSIPYLRGRPAAVYDIQIAFKKSDKEPTVMRMLLGLPVEAHLYVERIPLEQIPEAEEACAQWLHELYQKKVRFADLLVFTLLTCLSEFVVAKSNLDRMQDSFFKTDDFFAESGVKRVDGFNLKRRPVSLINTVIWGIVILVPMSYYLLRLLTCGSWFYFSVGISIIAVFFLLLSKMIGVTKISEASSYGKTSATLTSESKSSSVTDKTD
uniref:Phospholipid/glycerol acyltransferase domain-containing protein n=1 Tax=Timema genevievae TaxID=629358 RepID=A0A7R9K2D9_TIMGE|nr:unnamed protein product [Timema genevievae]